MQGLRASLLVFGCWVGVSLAASAEGSTLYSLQLSRSDGATWSHDEAVPTGNPPYSNDYPVNNGTWNFDWSVSGNPDPTVSSNLTIVNNTAATQTFTSLITLPISAIPGSTLTGGSIAGSVTDINNNGATLATASGSPFYTAYIDGVAFHTLYNDPSSFSVVAGSGSTAVPGAAFGTPIPSLPGPAASTSIAIQLKFTLTPGDSMSFTSAFTVEPVPEPVGLGIFGLAAVGLLGRRRRAA
jgi:hypothetical protein